MNPKQPRGKIAVADANFFASPIQATYLPQSPKALFLNRIKNICIRKGVRVIETTSGEFVPVNSDYVISDYVMDLYGLLGKGRFEGTPEHWVTLDSDETAYSHHGSQVCKDELKAGTSLLKKAYGNATVSGTVFVRNPDFADRARVRLGALARFVKL